MNYLSKPSKAKFQAASSKSNLSSKAAVAKALTNNSLDRTTSLFETDGWLTEQSTIPSDAVIQTQWGFSRAVLVMYVELSYELFTELERMPTPEEVNQALWAGRIEFPPGTLIYEATSFKVMSSEAFKTAAYYRGIRKVNDGLNPRQQLCIAAVTDYTSRASFDQKLARLGIQSWEFNAWMNFPPFRTRVERLSAKALKHSESLADVALAQGASQGKLEFIKYADLRSGKFDPLAQQSLDVTYVIKQVVEIIQRHVTDSGTLRAIGGELSLLAGAAGLDPRAGGSSAGNDSNLDAIPQESLNLGGSSELRPTTRTVAHPTTWPDQGMEDNDS